ncbi:MAG: restriction endonuclease subunit S [Acidobacteriota bacterium]|jgi:type I restriction enzyme S subunit|nr:restriction endonuclease subunit S [Acidobacteriota bacterium]
MKFPKKKVVEFAKVKGGKRLPKGEQLIAEKTAHPYIRGRDIKDGKVNFIQPTYITDKVFQQIQRYTVNAGDVCITIVGNIGDVAIIPNYLDGANLTENAVKLVNLLNCDSSYLKYSLLFDQVQTQMKSSAAGAAQPKLGIYKVNAIEIPFPELEIQQKIAPILSAYDDLIENNTRRITILEEMARRIYEEWFVKFRFPGHEQVKMVESELGLIPKGWKAKELGQISLQVRNSVDPNEIEPLTPYVGLEHIPRRSIALDSWGNAEDVQSTKHKFKKGNILFGKIRPYFHKVSVAFIDGICSSDAIVIESNPSFFPFVLGTVSSDAFVQHATQTSNGVKMPRANWDVLEKYPVFIPSDAIAKLYGDFIDPTIKQINSLVFKNRNLRKTRDLLLPKLISGEVDVSHFPNIENV